MTDLANTGNAAALIAAIEKNQERQALLVSLRDGANPVGAAILRDGESLKSIKPLLDEYLETPERLKGTTHLHDLPSFMAECKRFESNAVTVYIDAPCTAENPATITAVFNDHNAVSALTDPSSPERISLPNWRDHRAVYKPKLSPELLAWLSAQRPATQEDFAHFIEEHLLDVKSPNPSDEDQKALLDAAELLGLQLGSQARLLEVSRGLDLTSTSKIKGRANLQNGSTVMAYEDAVDTGPITVPGAVLLDIPVFEGAQRVLILARVRFAVKDGMVTWRVLLHDITGTFRGAVEALRQDIAESGQRVVLGTP